MLQHLCLNVRLNFLNKLKKIKAILPKDYGYDMAKWLSAISAARISTTPKSLRLYPDEIFISNLLDRAEQVPCKAWLSEVARIKNRWNLGEYDELTKELVISKLCQIYTKMGSGGDNSFFGWPPGK